jgi:hypothetical protein
VEAWGAICRGGGGSGFDARTCWIALTAEHDAIVSESIPVLGMIEGRANLIGYNTLK